MEKKVIYTEQDPCRLCGDSIREQAKGMCPEIACYRQFLKLGAIDQSSELTQLRAENERLKAALEQISRPIKFMKDNLKDGYKLDATHAFELSNDPYYLKSIANKALDPLT